MLIFEYLNAEYLNAAVHHAGPLVRVAAPLVELVEELPLAGEAGVGLPLLADRVPLPVVDAKIS